MKKANRKKTVNLRGILASLFIARITIARWQFNAFGVACLTIGVIIGGYYAVNHLLGAKAASSPWTQTDWSGGVGASTVNQYSAASNIEASTTPGQVTLASPLAGWQYRRRLTFNNTTAFLGTTSEALTDFPVLVKLTSGVNIDYSKVQGLGQDLRFTDSDGTTLLKYEIEKWDPTGTSYIWVKVPQVDINSSTDSIYLYYGNPGASDAQDPANVWDNHFLGVWHSKETSGAQLNDSTLNGNNGTKTSASQPNPTPNGVIGNAQSYGGSDRVGTPITTALNDFTVEVWFKDDGTASSYERLADKSYTQCFWLGRNSSNANSWGGGIKETSDPYGIFVNLTDGSWHQIATIRSGTTHYMYGDGGSVSASNTVSNSACDSTNFAIGAYGDNSGSQRFGGIIDEVRVSDIARSKAWIAASYKSGTGNFITYGNELAPVVASGSLTSNIFNTGYAADWGTVTFNTNGQGGTTVKARSSNSPTMSGAPDFTTCNAITSGTDISSNNCVSDLQPYIQYQILLTSVADIGPQFQDIAIAFSPHDVTAPTNPTSVTAKNSNGGPTTLTNATWYNYAAPSFTLIGATDAPGPEGNPSGIAGYYVYFGTDNTANPTTAGSYQTSSTFTASGLNSGSTYYLRVTTQDAAGNTNATPAALFTYKYDSTPPTNPSYVSASPAGYSATNSFSFLWPAGSDAMSGLDPTSAYCYKTGAPAATDTCIASTLTLVSGITSYQTGANVFFLRTKDAAGNTNPAYVQVTYYYNPDAPSAPQNLTVSPTSNTTNAFAFSWSAPQTYKGQIAGYRYSVNALPTATNTTLTTATSLASGPYATQVGENILYVVAIDDSGNVNYDSPASVAFSAQTSSPAIPVNVTIADASSRATSRYALTVSWDAPNPRPSDFAGYIIERAVSDSLTEVNVTSLSFMKIAQVTTTIYSDAGLDSTKQYFYRVKTADTTANVSAASTSVYKIPTGKFTDAPAITKGPSITAKSTSADFVWATDRSGTSLVQCGPTTAYGISAGQLDAVTEHEVTMKGLTPGATYHCHVQTTDVPELVDYSTTDKGFSPDVVFKTLDAPGITDISVTNITLSGAILSWKTNVVATSTLVYGTSLAYGQSVNDQSSSSTTNHAVLVKGLRDSTSYHFRIKSVDSEGNLLQSDDYVFDTLKLPVATNIQFQPIKNQPAATMQITWDTNVPTTSVVSYSGPGAPSQESSKAALETKHDVTITNLIDDTEYTMSVGGRDGFGNAVVGGTQHFHTATDSRPPVVSDITVEAQTQGTADQAKAQLVVSWNTDEPSSAQVEYGPGLSSDSYPNQTVEDDAYSESHVVVVSELKPASTYHLRVLSHDRAGNLTTTGDHVVITGRATTSVLNVIIQNLQRSFGWLGSIGK